MIDRFKMTFQNPGSYPRPYGGLTVREVLAHAGALQGEPGRHDLHTITERDTQTLQTGNGSTVTAMVLVCSCGARFYATIDLAVRCAVPPQELLAFLRKRVP